MRRATLPTVPALLLTTACMGTFEPDLMGWSEAGSASGDASSSGTTGTSGTGGIDATGDGSTSSTNGSSSSGDGTDTSGSTGGDEGAPPDAAAGEPCDPWWVLQDESPCSKADEPGIYLNCRPFGKGDGMGGFDYEFVCFEMKDESFGPLGFQLEDPCNGTYGLDVCQEGYCSDSWPTWPAGTCADATTGCCTIWCDPEHPCPGNQWACVTMWDIDGNDVAETGYCASA